MTPYFIIFGIIAFLTFLEPLKGLERTRFIAMCVVAGILTLFAGLRGVDATPDTVNYVYNFLRTPGLVGSSIEQFVRAYNSGIGYEVGYFLLSSLVRSFSDSYTVFLVIVAGLAVGITTFNYYRYTPYVFLALLLYFAHVYLRREMVQIRAGVAAAIGLFLIQQFKERDHLKIAITIAVAMCFHLASVIYVLAYGCSFLNLNRKRIVVGLAVALVLGAIGISGMFVSLLPRIGPITSDIHGYYDSQHAYELGILDITNIKNLAIMAVVLVYWGKMEDRLPYFDVLVTMMSLATVWRLTFSDFAVFAGRGATFFAIAEVLLLTGFVSVFEHKTVVRIVLIIFAFLMLYLNLTVEEVHFLPYETAVF